MEQSDGSDPVCTRMCEYGRSGSVPHLQQVGVVADLAQDVNAGKGLAVASKDGVHLLAVKVGSIQLPLVLAQLAKQHLR